jgi:N-acetyl sugar amidotransferase
MRIDAMDKPGVWSASDPAYRQCTKTVMDNIADPDIHFDENGICNYYHEYMEVAKTQLYTEADGRLQLESLVNSIKKNGEGKPYDCLIGLSGGVDSSYVAYIVKQYGLRPLAVHLDNGWNAELAVKNIEQIINKLNIDLYTLVINWQEFRDIQLSYLQASVVDIEVVSDHAIFATMYKLAKEKNIGYIISGTNMVTEHIMPPSWLYRKMDAANLKDIHRTYGKLPLKTYPIFNFRKQVYYSALLKLRPVSILNYLPYKKEEAKALLIKELGWRDYGGKHYESVFTKFFQAYILPVKFGIDKRKAHLSNLVCSGQLSRQAALLELQKPLLTPEEEKTDKEYVLKKLGLSVEAFEQIMQLPRRQHTDFKTDTAMHNRYMNLLLRTQKLRRVLK